ncbi:MAG TPA: PA0069 family radical SAM protein [Acetobacteraceae bacterium]|nr:PA0069 family radical SAM protein [Acetobacteraceae bacterium]
MPDGAQVTRELDRDALAALSRAGEPEPPPEERSRSLARDGRGAVTNPKVRYDRQSTTPFDDGWSFLTEPEELPPLQTTLHRDSSKSVIAWNESPDIGFDRAVNPYRGCEHGCIYCYARPSHAYLGYSPGLEFETQIVYKPDVAALLERELSKPGYEPRTLALGSNTDPYQPVERTLRLTRSILEVLDRFNHPVTIVTKSAGVVRDVDVLQRLAGRGLVRVCVSVTTLDPALARRMEPRASSPALRLRAIEALTKAGVPTGVLAAPMIPGLNDAEMEHLLEAAHRAGARSGGYVLLRLPHELREMFTAWLEEHVPDRARRVLALIRETRAGALNDSRFHDRFRGRGAYADLMSQRFTRISRKLGLEERTPLDASQFRPPAAQEAQLSLF